MPRRNFHCLLLITLFSLVCYQKVPGSRYSRVLADAMDRVVRRFYLPVDELNLFEGAMSGMIKGLGDEHSIYIKATKKQEFEDDLNQEFVGIGILPVIDPKTKEFFVLGPLPDGPAAAAGIRAGDRIVKIEGQSTQGLSLSDAVQRIRGKPGTAITLTIQHQGAAQPIDLSIVRQVIHEDTVEGDSRDPDGRWNFLLPGDRKIGYIRISGFAEADQGEKETATDFRAALEQLRSAGIHGLVLDLRGNGGGSLKAAVAICDMLIAKGEIVTTRGRDGRIAHSFRASGKAPFTDFPIAVLVNRGSASASEIVAGCLQDHDRAIVVGERSYGKGTVQEVVDMGDTFGAMKLTIATYWRPSGQNINRPKEDAKNDSKNATWGVSPNEGYDVPVEDDERNRLLSWQQERELAALNGGKSPAGGEVPDRVLLKAIEYLESKVGK
ncbi:MAG: S41 family peptidase [Thermoguttaceae bacterium]|jgi:carboxyl-terminal processing protease